MLKDEKKILNSSTLISGGGFKGVAVFLSHVAALGVHCRDLIVSTNPRPRPRHALLGTAPPGARAGQKQRCQSPLSPGPSWSPSPTYRCQSPPRAARPRTRRDSESPSLPKTGCRGRSSAGPSASIANLVRVSVSTTRLSKLFSFSFLFLAIFPRNQMCPWRNTRGACA